MNNTSTSSKVVLNSIIYSISGLLLKCFSFFLLPLYTTYLTTEDYGVTSIASSFLLSMSFIVAFSLFSAVMRFYVDYRDEPELLRRFYGTVVSFVFVSSIGFALALAIFRNLLSKYVFTGISFYPIILICLVSLAFNCQHTIYENILRSQQKALKSAILSITYFFITVLLNILFVVVLRRGATGVLIATLIASVLYTLYFLVDMYRSHSITLCIDSGILKSALKYSIPIMPHNLSTNIAVLVSKALIGGTSTLASLGVYSVASQFGNMADTIQGYIDQAYGPWLFERLHDKDISYKKTIRNTANMLTAVIGFFFIGISLFAQDYIILFINKSYVGAWRYVPFIVMVFSIKTMYYFYVNILFYYKKASRLLFTATLTGSFVNVFISFMLIPKWGVYGSIFADAIAMIIRLCVIVMISRQFGDVGLNVTDFILKIFVVALFIGSGLALSYSLYSDNFSFVNFSYKILILLIYAIFVYFSYKNQIYGFINSRRGKKNECKGI